MYTVAYVVCSVKFGRTEIHRNLNCLHFSELGLPGGQTLSWRCVSSLHHTGASQCPYKAKS